MSNLGSCYGNLGTARLDDGDLDDAVAWTIKALAIQDEQIKKHPNSVDYLERVGANHMVLGQLEFRTGHLTAARTELEQGRAHLERLKHVRPGDAGFAMHLVECLGMLSEVEIERSATAPALNLARRAVAEADEILAINPKYHPASNALAHQLLREAEIAWNVGESDHALANLDRAEAILRQLVGAFADLPSYRADLAAAIRVHIQRNSEIGRDDRAEARLREAASIMESVLRDDPNQVSNQTTAASVYSDLGAALGRRDQSEEARSLFGRALKLLDPASRRSPADEQVRRILIQTLSSRAEMLARLGLLRESLADWDRALTLPAGAATAEVRLRRACVIARTGDYSAASTSDADAKGTEADRAKLLIRYAVLHACVLGAISRDSALSPSARAAGVAAQLEASLDLIGQARRTLAYRDARRLRHALADHEFDPLRAYADFRLLMKDLALPADPFAR